MAKKTKKYKYAWQERLASPDDPTEVRVEGNVIYSDPRFGGKMLRAYPRVESEYLWQPLLWLLRTLGISYRDASYFMADETTTQIRFNYPEREVIVQAIIHYFRSNNLGLTAHTFQGGRLNLTVTVPYKATRV